MILNIQTAIPWGFCLHGILGDLIDHSKCMTARTVHADRNTSMYADTKFLCPRPFSKYIWSSSCLTSIQPMMCFAAKARTERKEQPQK